MHYCIHVLTKEFPTEAMLEDIMAPYNENDYYRQAYDEEGNERDDIERPDILWDFWLIGGRYNGKIKLKVDEKDDKYKWQYITSYADPRNGRLFWCAMLSTIKEYAPRYTLCEENCFNYLGYRDGYLRVDGAKISDTCNISELSCYAFINPDGTLCVREKWDGSNCIEDPDFDIKYRQAVDDNSDGYLTVIDIHD